MRRQEAVLSAGHDDRSTAPDPGALQIHAPSGVVPPEPFEHLQHPRMPGNVSAGPCLETRDRAEALGPSLSVLELHAGIVTGLETLRHAGQRVTLRRSVPPADDCVEPSSAAR